MTKEEKIKKCQVFFDQLSESLTESYERIGSCNNDISEYLIPKGTISELTYTSKPDISFRISDHWNWYSNVKKCPNEKYIQCFTKDTPWAKKRPEEGKASKPINATSVALFIYGRYYVVYGEYFDRKNKTWHWRESTIADIFRTIQKGELL